jgi:hypothetical protein
MVKKYVKSCTKVKLIVFLYGESGREVKRHPLF